PGGPRQAADPLDRGRARPLHAGAEHGPEGAIRGPVGGADGEVQRERLTHRRKMTVDREWAAVSAQPSKGWATLKESPLKGAQEASRALSSAASGGFLRA